MTNIKTQKEIKSLLSVIDKTVLKRLRPIITTNSYRRKDGSYIGLHLPAFINLNVDDKFEISSNDITYKIQNSKACVTVWKDESVSAQITVY